MKVKVINKSNNNLPEYSQKGDACMDLRANLKEPIVLDSLDRAIIPTGLFMEIPKGYSGDIRSRSGLAIKNGIIVLNSPGTIDHGYNKEIGVILINLSLEKFVIENGFRIGQFKITKSEEFEWEEVDEIKDKNRSDGFGSSGIK